MSRNTSRGALCLALLLCAAASRAQRASDLNRADSAAVILKRARQKAPSLKTPAASRVGQNDWQFFEDGLIPYPGCSMLCGPVSATYALDAIAKDTGGAPVNSIEQVERLTAAYPDHEGLIWAGMSSEDLAALLQIALNERKIAATVDIRDYSPWLFHERNAYFILPYDVWNAQDVKKINGTESALQKKRLWGHFVFLKSDSLFGRLTIYDPLSPEQHWKGKIARRLVSIVNEDGSVDQLKAQLSVQGQTSPSSVYLLTKVVRIRLK